MDKLEELKNQLKALSQEETESLREYLNNEIVSSPESTEEVSSEETETQAEETEAQAEATDVAEEALPLEEEIPNMESEETMVETEEVTGVEDEANAEKDVPSEPEVETNAEAAVPPPTFDDIPKMNKGVGQVDEKTATEPQMLTADTGEEIPVDYEQIIEAQNAKIAALQAENASLKTKVEGAFGYSAKPANSVKVNRLYDDAVDVHFHK